MLLDTISSPHDLRNLTDEQLNQLAEEIRQEILDTILEIGGHFAPSLGAVELTIALHHTSRPPLRRDAHVPHALRAGEGPNRCANIASAAAAGRHKPRPANPSSERRRSAQSSSDDTA